MAEMCRRRRSLELTSQLPGIVIDFSLIYSIAMDNGLELPLRSVNKCITHDKLTLES